MLKVEPDMVLHMSWPLHTKNGHSSLQYKSCKIIWWFNLLQVKTKIVPGQPLYCPTFWRLIGQRSSTQKCRNS